MPNSTVKAYNKAVIATVNAAELMKVDAPEREEESEELGEETGEESAPLSSEDAKKRLVMAEYLKKQGGSIIEDESCPNCGSVLGLIPKGSRKFKVCTQQFKDDPDCYWVKEEVPVQPATPLTEEMLLEAEEREIEIEAERQSRATAKKSGEAPQITYHAAYFDD